MMKVMTKQKSFSLGSFVPMDSIRTSPKQSAAPIRLSLYKNKDGRENNVLRISGNVMKQLGWVSGDKIQVLYDKSRSLICVTKTDGTTGRTLSGPGKSKGKSVASHARWLINPRVINFLEQSEIEDYSIVNNNLVFEVDDKVSLP